MTGSDLRIVFFGTPDFAVESLRRIHDDGYKIVGVVTATDKPAGRGHKMLPSAVKQYAVANGLHLMQPAKLRDPDFIEELRGLDADLFIVIAFRMLPEIVWTMPRLGTFNLHASLLPRYRGAAPINWAIINGDTETGVTTFMLKHEIDTGDILRQERIDIAPDENAGSVHDRLMRLGADVTIDTIRRIISGTLTPVPQVDGEASTAPKIFKEDCRIKWDVPAENVRNLVRGLSPYPAAWTELTIGGQSVNMKILDSCTTTERAASPGFVTVEGSRLLVDCADFRLELLTVQPAGKKRMSAADYLRGLR